MYSISSATAHSISRACPAARPPATQNTADSDSQARIRTAFSRAGIRLRGIEASQNRVRPTCIAA